MLKENLETLVIKQMLFQNCMCRLFLNIHFLSLSHTKKQLEFNSYPFAFEFNSKLNLHFHLYLLPCDLESLTNQSLSLIILHFCLPIQSNFRGSSEKFNSDSSSRSNTRSDVGSNVGSAVNFVRWSLSLGRMFYIL